MKFDRSNKPGILICSLHTERVRIFVTVCKMQVQPSDFVPPWSREKLPCAVLNWLFSGIAWSSVNKVIFHFSESSLIRIYRKSVETNPLHIFGNLPWWNFCKNCAKSNWWISLCFNIFKFLYKGVMWHLYLLTSLSVRCCCVMLTMVIVQSYCLYPMK